MESSRTLKLPSNEDSFDEDALSDVDDEVFIKSSRNGFRNSNKDRTLQKPLMAPRQKHEKNKVKIDFLFQLVHLCLNRKILYFRQI